MNTPDPELILALTRARELDPEAWEWESPLKEDAMTFRRKASFRQAVYEASRKLTEEMPQ